MAMGTRLEIVLSPKFWRPKAILNVVNYALLGVLLVGNK